MLKVKDDVDLKILSNFKFEYDDFFGKWYFNDGVCENIRINHWNRKISIESTGEGASKILLNLIEENLIEYIDE